MYHVIHHRTVELAPRQHHELNANPAMSDSHFLLYHSYAVACCERFPAYLTVQKRGKLTSLLAYDNQ